MEIKIELNTNKFVIEIVSDNYYRNIISKKSRTYQITCEHRIKTGNEIASAIY